MPNKPTSNDKGLVIHKATYGGPDVERRMDVTELLRSKVINGRLKVRVSNDLFGRDPLVGIVKVLEITYNLDGEEHTRVVPETWSLVVPEIEPEVVAVVANTPPGEYGAQDEGWLQFKGQDAQAQPEPGEQVEATADAEEIERKVQAAVEKVRSKRSEKQKMAPDEEA